MQKLLLVYYHNSENRASSQIWKVLPNMVFSPLGGKNGGILSMRMQVILDSPFARPGSAPIGGRKKRRVQGSCVLKASVDRVSVDTIGRYSDRHSADMSAECRSLYRPIVSTDTRSTDALSTHDPCQII